MKDPLSFAIQLAQQAGDLLAASFQTDGMTADWKADHTLVTQADYASDRLIAGAIRQDFPDDLLMSEEQSPSYPFGSRLPDRAVWVVDPLDGTSNFHLGLYYWGVLIARLVDGMPDIAAIYFPLLHELYSAQKGHGAWLNGKPLHIQSDQYRKLSFFACCSRTLQRYHTDIPYKTRIFGCAAYTYCAVARNTAMLGFEATPRVWDIAGAWLVIEEAGGVLAALDGQSPFPFRPGIDYARQDFPTLAAANPERLAWGLLRITPK
jgi:myo-inositol-1(or 4)-monophosphatase